MELLRNVSRRTSQNAAFAMERASANVSETMNHPKVQHFSMFSSIGYGLGMMFYFGFIKFALCGLLIMALGGHLPDKVGLMAEWDNFKSGGIEALKQLPHDVLAFCGICSGVILSLTSFSNIFYIAVFFLITSAFGV